MFSSIKKTFGQIFPSPPASALRQNSKLFSLQYVRAIAAWAVVYYHATVYLNLLTGFDGYFNWLKGRPGLYGVMAFFVVSGYLMASIAPKYNARTFLTHRVLRIYPLYWLCVLFAWGIYAWLWQFTLPDPSWVPVLSQMLYGGEAFNILRLTLVPIVFPDAPLGIEWTLLYETTFYALVFGLIVVGQIRWLNRWALAWLALILVTTVFHPAWQLEGPMHRPTLVTFLVQVPNVAFILGILGVRYQHRFSAIPLLASGLILLMLVEFFDSPWALHQVCAGVAALVFGIVALERQGWLRELPFLSRLGEWSYALYLLHVLSIFTVLKLTPDWAPWAKVSLIACLAFSLSAAFGTLDIGLYRRLKRLFDTASVRWKNVLVSLFLIMFSVVGVVGALVTKVP